MGNKELVSGTDLFRGFKLFFYLKLSHVILLNCSITRLLEMAISLATYGSSALYFIWMLQ